MSEHDSLHHEILLLKSRIERLEGRLGIAPPPLPAWTPAAPPTAPAARAQTPPPATLPPIDTPAAPASVEPIETEVETFDFDAPAKPIPGTAPPAVRYDVTPSPRAAAPRSRFGDFEQLIGGRWYAVLGALAVVIGIGLFVKLAYDQGWLRVPPAWRCAGGAAFGVGLIIAADVLRRRLGAWAAFGAYAAGLGCVYISTFAAYALYQLLTPAWCFGLLSLTAVLGVGVGMRSKLAAVSVLALASGYLAPVLLHNAPSNVWTLPIYLSLLTAIGLSVSWRAGRGFHAVRLATWIGTLGLGLVWSVSDGRNEPWLNATFLTLIWAVLQSELVWSTRKGVWSGVGVAGRMFEALALTGSMVATAWYGLLLTMLAERTGMMPNWLGALMGCAASACGAVLAGGSPSVILDRPRRAPERLGSCMALQSAGMGMVALTLAVSGPTESLAWIALGAGAVLAGWKTDLLGVRLYALALLIVGTLRLALYDSFRTSMGSGVIDFAGLHLSLWMALMAGTGVLWLVVARAGLPRRGASVTRPIASALGLIVLIGATSHSQNSPSAQVAAWGTVLALALAARALVPGGRLAEIATLLLGIPTLFWFATQTTRQWPPGAFPLTYSGFLAGMYLAAVCFGAWWRLSRGAEREVGFFTAPAAAGFLLLFATTSFEAGRTVEKIFEDQTAQRAAMSLWWGVFAAGLLTLGFVRERAWLRHCGLGLLGIAALKVVLYDLAGVSQVWRIVSFLGLGLLMLGVSVVYAKATRQEAKTAA